MPEGPRSRLARLTPFLCWAVWFLAAWVVAVAAFGLWSRVAEHWATAVAMVFGAYIGGSTPLGGGTVGFPLLVLVFDEPASLGRGFSLCIQATGLTSATIYMVCTGRRFVVRPLVWACVAATIATPLTLWQVAPHVDDALVTLTFGIIWGGFGILTLAKLREVLTFDSVPEFSPRFEMLAGLAAGLFGGLAAGLTGVGANMVLYTVLILLYRAEIRAAIASAVVLMCYASILGAVTSAAMGALDSEVFFNWLAAAPIVVVGAPLGALACRVIPRGPTLVLVAVLCLLQLVYITWTSGRSGWGIAGVVIAVLAMNGAFHGLYIQGKRTAARRGAA